MSSSSASASASTSKDEDDDNLRPSSREDMKKIAKLAQLVVRTFYNDTSIVIVDQLVGIQAMPVDVLAGRMGSISKEINAHCTRLVDDGIISLFRRNEARDVQYARSTPRIYYYIDYRSLIDVLKWRMMTMRKQIEAALKSGVEQKGYVCPRCSKAYLTLDVGTLMDMSTGLLICETPGCGTEVIDNEDAEEVRKGKDRVRRFNTQCEKIRNGLREVEGIRLPHFDIALWVSQNSVSLIWRAPGIEAPPALTLKSHASNNNQSQLSSLGNLDVASNSGPSNLPGSGSSGVRIEMSSNDPKALAEKKRKEEEEKEKMRKQNVLASWHTESTVSGELTALGRKEEERRNKLERGEMEVKSGEKVEEDGVEDYYASYAKQQQQQQPAEEAAPSTKRQRSEEVQGEDRNPKKAKEEQQGQNQSQANGGGAGDEEEEMDDFEEVV